jgi:hypothetical protein
MAVHPIERAREVAALFRDAMATAPDELMISLGLGIATPDGPFPPELIGHPIIALGATHSGALEDAERHVQSLRGLDPVLDTFGPKSYLSVQEMSDEGMAWGKRFYMKGGFLAALTDEAMDACVEHVARSPGDCSISLWAHGGAIGRVPNDAMAFTGRDAACWLGVEALWEDPALDDAHVAWGRATMSALQPFTASGHYVNDVVETGEGIVRSIYGDAKYERLVSLKRAFDPDNVFRLNQNILP